MIEKRLRKYIIPNVLGILGTSFDVLADTFFISNAGGANGLTSLNLTLPIFSIIQGIGVLIGMGSAIRYGLDKASGDENANSNFSNSVIWVMLFGSIFVFAGLFFPDLVLRLMGADDVILDFGLRYMQVVLLCSPFFMLNYTFTAFVRNDGSPNIVMVATLISGAFNIVGDWIFIFPLKMGMFGAALATGLTPFVSILICTTHFLKKSNTLTFPLQSISFKKCINACKLGSSSFFTEMSSGLTTLVFNFILLALGGNIAVAAYGVVANVAIVAKCLFKGVGDGLQPLASEMHGKGDIQSEKRIYKHSLFIGNIMAVVIVALVFVFTDEIIALFNSDNSIELAEYANVGIRIYFIGFFFASINIIKAGFYCAVDNPKVSTAIALTRGIFGIIVITFILSALFGVNGVWLSFPITELFTIIFTFIMVRKIS